MNPEAFKEVEFIYGNSNKRFSGVTSTMLQVLPRVNQAGKTVVLGQHHLPEGMSSIGFWQAAKLLRTAPNQNSHRLFHARRNDEMIQALLLKVVFRAKIKIVFTSTAQRKKTWLTRWLMRQMDGLISTCDAAAQFMPDPPDEIIPHGIDVSLFSEASPLVGKVELPAKKNIGLFGRVRSQKGADLLMDAAVELLSEFPDWGVVFVGEITEEQKIFASQQRDKAEKAGIAARVLFTGKLPFDHVPAYFQCVDIVCALSVNEGFGLTVLEGAAASKPVVATKAGAWPDILSAADIGCLIDVGDLPALLRSLKYLMTDPAKALELGKNASRLVHRDYSVEREVKSLVAYYRAVLKN